MPTFYTNLSTAQVAAENNFNQRLNDSRWLDGPTEFTDAVYTVLGTEVAADIIVIADLPIGAIVYPEQSFLFNETDPGTTLTLDIGDSVDVDRYADGIAAAVAGRVEFTSTVLNVDGVVNRYRVEATTRRVQALVSAAVSSLSAGAKIHFRVAYKCLGT